MRLFRAHLVDEQHLAHAAALRDRQRRQALLVSLLDLGFGRLEPFRGDVGIERDDRQLALLGGGE